MDNRKKHKIRKTNARLFSIYKMLSFDLLFYYPIEFLFCTLTKGISVSQVLYVSSIYLIAKIITQSPVVHGASRLGNSKTIVLGNCMLILSILLLIIVPGMLGVVIANIIMAFAFNFKTMTEEALLFETVATRGGSGLFSKINSKGSSFHYLLDGVTALTSGYLFVFNNYLPMYICLGFIVLATLLSLGFRDLSEPVKKRVRYKTNIFVTIRKRLHTNKDYYKKVLRSNRLRSFIFFNLIFYSFIMLTNTYLKAVFLNMGVSEEQFALVLAIATLFTGLSLFFCRKIEKKLRNKTLTVLSLTYVILSIALGVAAMFTKAKWVISLAVVVISVLFFIKAMWYTIKFKYLMNFTENKERNPITFVNESISSIGASITSFVGGLTLEHLDVNKAMAYSSIIFLVLTIVAIIYMRDRFGLKPSKYSKKDIRLGF